MRAYVIRRLVLIVPTLLIVTFVIFLLIRLMPGNVVDAIIAQMYQQEGGQRQMTTMDIQRARLMRELGLDEPVHIAYGRWMGFIRNADGNFSGIFQGNLGRSFWDKMLVLDMITPRLPVTIQLGLMALIMTYVVAVPIGIYAAVRQDTWGDYVSRSFAIAWLAVPNFWLGTMVMVLPAIWWVWSPPIKYISFSENPIGNFGMFIIPALIMGLSSSGGMMRQTRTWMLEVLRQDYIRTAWAKGLKERTVLIRHAFRNTLIPIVTGIGYQLPILVGGTVIMENIFVLPGLGQLGLMALMRRDYPVVGALLLLSAIVIVFANLLADLSYAWVDPRIRYS